MHFFVFFWWFWRACGLPEFSWSQLGSRYQNRLQILFGALLFGGSFLEPFWLPNQIFGRWSGVNFLTYFWCRFREASGTNLGGFWGHLGVHLGVILRPVLSMLQNCKNATPLKQHACFWWCRAFILASCSVTFWILFWCCCLDCIFATFWQILASKWSPVSSPCSSSLQIWPEKMDAYFRAWRNVHVGL